MAASGLSEKHLFDMSTHLGVEKRHSKMQRRCCVCRAGSVFNVVYCTYIINITIATARGRGD
jgi:hypothetical protein